MVFKIRFLPPIWGGRVRDPFIAKGYPGSFMGLRICLPPKAVAGWM
jgi:hypothetical protein